MFLPRHRATVHFPEWLLPTSMGVTAITVTLLAWAAFAAQPTSNGSEAVLPAAPSAPIASVAYWVSEGGKDVIYVRHAATGRKSFVASFQPFQPAAGLHIRGKASPAAEQIAVLSVSQPTADAQLTFVDVATGAKREAPGGYDHLSEIAWSRDGLRVVLAGANGTTLFEVDSRTLTATGIARFAGARSAAPMGYSLNGRRLFVVVVDQAGSSLWSMEGTKASRIASLSPGLTASWSLSPDGSRLAFIDVLGVGEQRYAGRTLMLATGQILSAAPAGDQLGAAWRPGGELAEFGGPGGSFELFGEPRPGPSYVVPVQWSPDGRWLVASIFSAQDDGTISSLPSVELARPGEPIRVPLSDDGEGPATFLGWVQNIIE